MSSRSFLTKVAAGAGVLLLVGCKDAGTPAAGASDAGAKAGAAPAADLKAVATKMVAAAMVKAGDRVLITGSARDNALMENLAIETMKNGGQPLIAVGSDDLTRRAYEEVPASYDSQKPTLGLALADAFDVQLTVEVGEAENLLAGVPAARLAARAKAAVPVSEAFIKRGIRGVDLGNGLYPTAALAGHLGKPLSEVSSVFWKAVNVPPEVIRTKGEGLRAALQAGKKVELTSANGTSITFVTSAKDGFVSDGAITAERVKQGRGAPNTWLPAGELLVPVTPGTAEGKIVIDKLVFQGAMVEGLTLSFTKGRLTTMTATSGIDPLRALYDASGSNKELFSYIDLGLNPEAKLPTNTGRVIWMVPGGVTIGMGDNTGWGGSNVSDFGLAGAITAATLKIDGKAVIEGGVPK